MEIISSQQYTLELRQDGLFFSRQPAQEGDLPLGVDQVLTQARSLGLPAEREADFVKHFREALGVEIVVCPSDEIVSTDGTVAVSVANDGLWANAQIQPPTGFGKAAGRQEVEEALQGKGVTFGLLGEEIDTLVASGGGEPMVIARGRPAEDGIDGRVELKFEKQDKGKPQEMADGSVNFHELNLISIVEKGGVLAEVIPPVPGVAGMNVLGKEIRPKEGKPVLPPVGKNVSYSEDNRLLVAEITGEVVLDKSKVSVLATHTSTTDIGPETGDIDFAGSVVVRGSILSGYSVRATGSVDVHGQIIGGIVEAGGDVIARVGIQGQGHGYIRSGGNVMAKFVENAKISASGDVDGGEAILQSNVDSGGMVKAINRKGVIVGGLIRAARVVHANILGAEIGTQTDVEIGVNPLYREEFKEISSVLPEKEKDLEKVKKAVAMLKQMEKAANGVLPDDRRQMLANLTKTQFQLIGAVAEMQKRRVHLEAELEQAKLGKLMARDYIYPGVRLMIGKARMHIQDTIQHATLALEDWEIRIGPY